MLNFDEVDKPKKVIISKIEETISGSKIQSSLSLRVFLSAKNLKEAINEAKSFADGVISFVALTTGVGLDIPSENLAFEITPKVETREHIGGSIRWYRLGTTTVDVFDRFNCFWIGLEALNPILQNKLKVGDDKTRCPKCQYEWVCTPTVSGIRVFVQTKIPDGKKVYKRSRELRINLMHSKENLTKLHAEATELSSRVGEVLYRAICYLLGIVQWENMEYRKILEKISMRIELEATLVDGEPAALGLNGKDPCFEPTHEFAPKFSDAGITFEGKTDFVARLNPNVKYRPREIRFYGDSEMKGSITATKVHKQDEVR
jgi:hypothetical protein